MATIKEGAVTIAFDDSMELPEKAGKLSDDEIRRLPKPPRGIGLVGELTAQAMVNAGQRFQAPDDVTPDALRSACQQADDYDQVVIDLEVALRTAKQANLLSDVKAWEMLRKVNDQLKVQVKHKPELAPLFQALTEFMRRKPRSPKSTPTE